VEESRSSSLVEVFEKHGCHRVEFCRIFKLCLQCIPMAWNDGDVWTVEAQLPQG
jgi:hypothetical protein